MNAVGWHRTATVGKDFMVKMLNREAGPSWKRFTGNCLLWILINAELEWNPYKNDFKIIEFKVIGHFKYSPATKEQDYKEV